MNSMLSDYFGAHVYPWDPTAPPWLVPGTLEEPREGGSRKGS